MVQCRRPAHSGFLWALGLWSVCLPNLNFSLPSLKPLYSSRLRVKSSGCLYGTHRRALDLDKSSKRYTWAEAHDIVKQVEAQLTRVASDSRRRADELNDLFTGSVIPLGGPIPGQPPLPVGPDIGGERVFPDIEKCPPILAGDLATGKRIT
eukprot:4406795-Amphidinium_carterae.2